MPIQNRILISHESPNCLLKDSRTYNDFDYALVHLFDEYPEYFNFFKTSLKVYDREVLLDNSLFELGKAFDGCRYVKRIEELQPTMAIAPDVFQDGLETVNNYKKFIMEYGNTLSDLRTTVIGTVHGTTWQELVDCYKYMADYADMIAISFDFKYYQITGEGRTHDERAFSGRQRLIQQLIDKGIWEWYKPHHLLGCSLPQEFNYYRNNNIYNIRSVDTSSPVVHGMFKRKYNGTLGLKDKVKTKLADVFNQDVNEEQLDVIKYNIKQFRYIVNGY